MFSEKKVELTEGEKLFLDSIYDLILNLILLKRKEAF